MLHRLRTGECCLTRAELTAALSEADRAILTLTENGFDGKAACGAFLTWCQRTMQELAQME